MAFDSDDMEVGDSGGAASPMLSQPFFPPNRHPGRRHYRSWGKRGMDIALISLSLPIVLPLVLIVALLAATDGHKPFYTQLRVGRNKRRFRILKIRTMVPDADRILHEYLASNPSARAEWDEKQKLTNDVRITRMGRLLRKTSLDELPQLWNVLTGDMSLVGPRPMMVDQEDLYPGRAYFRMRPGITGFWQISDRNQSSFAARALFDYDYARALSLTTDVKVLMRTVGVVFKGTGV